jgi:hypothetical protein
MGYPPHFNSVFIRVLSPRQSRSSAIRCLAYPVPQRPQLVQRHGGGRRTIRNWCSPPTRSPAAPVLKRTPLCPLSQWYPPFHEHFALVYAYLRWSDKNAYADPLLRMPRFHLALFKEADVKHAIKIRSREFSWIPSSGG